MQDIKSRVSSDIIKETRFVKKGIIFFTVPIGLAPWEKTSDVGRRPEKRIDLAPKKNPFKRTKKLS